MLPRFNWCMICLRIICGFRLCIYYFHTNCVRLTSGRIRRGKQFNRSGWSALETGSQLDIVFALLMLMMVRYYRIVLMSIVLVLGLCVVASSFTLLIMPIINEYIYTQICYNICRRTAKSYAKIRSKMKIAWKRTFPCLQNDCIFNTLMFAFNFVSLSQTTSMGRERQQNVYAACIYCRASLLGRYLLDLSMC